MEGLLLQPEGIHLYTYTYTYRGRNQECCNNRHHSCTQSKQCMNIWGIHRDCWCIQSKQSIETKSLSKFEVSPIDFSSLQLITCCSKQILAVNEFINRAANSSKGNFQNLTPLTWQTSLTVWNVQYGRQLSREPATHIMLSRNKLSTVQVATTGVCLK